MQLTRDLRMRDLFKQAKETGRPVTIHLNGSTSFTGVVGEVGEQNVVLTRLSNRDFFDALIRMEEIAAVEVQVRGL